MASVSRSKFERLILSAFLLASTSMTIPSNAPAQQSAPKKPATFHFVQPEPINFDDHVGWTQIFDGKTLNNWDGRSDVWRVEDGAIVGESTPGHPSGTTNIIWRGGEPANFELKLEMKLDGEGANGGIQYRSSTILPEPRSQSPGAADEQKKGVQQSEELVQKHARWDMRGYQADFDYSNRYSGQLYEQSSPRGIIAWRSQVVATEADKKPTLLGSVGNADELKTFIKPGEWNQVEIIAEDHTLIHIINGHVMSILVDTDPQYSQTKGLIALEIEGPGTLKISHRNIWLKTLP